MNNFYLIKTSTRFWRVINLLMYKKYSSRFLSLIFLPQLATTSRSISVTRMCDIIEKRRKSIGKLQNNFILKSRAIFLFRFCFINISNIFFSFVTCSMHKNQSCKTCSNFLRVKFKVFDLPQNMAFSNSNIYINSQS